MKKYRLTEETKVVRGIKLFRIEAVIEFSNIKVGEKGGWIEKEENLSQYDNAWVYDNARVYDNACVYDNARVYDNAWVYGDAEVYGNACVFGDAEVYGNACVYDNACVFGDAEVYGNACVSKRRHVSWFSVFGSCNRTTTLFKTKEGFNISCGCFLGTIDEFEKQINQTHGNSVYGQEYLAICNVMRIRINSIESEENDEK